MNIRELSKNPNIRKYFAVIVVVGLFVFVSGRMSGYLVAEDSYGTEIANLTASYNELNESYVSCLSDVSDLNFVLAAAETEKSDLTNNLNTCNSDLASVRSSVESKDASINSLTAERDTLASGYTSLAASSAKALCCVKKIFDPSLVAYYIENNAIVCTNDASKTAFTC